MQRKSRRAVLAAVLAMGLSGAAFAGQPPSAGLGQSWPNAADVSLNPHYHAYVFVAGGITYIQINDAAGNVLGAVGTASGQFIVLPVGQSQSVSTPQQSASSSSATPAAATAPVYNDGTTVITATPMSDGSTQIKAATSSTCDDPTVCGTQGGA